MQNAANRRVLVLERTAEGEWNAVLGEIGGDRVSVLQARILDGAATGQGSDLQSDLSKLANGAEVVLVSNSASAVCRSLDVPSASSEQTRRAVALRLETELPYPVAESTWVWERQETAGGDVLVIATATADIEEAEGELRAKKRRCAGVEFDGASLAELAVAYAPTTEIIALVRVDENRATLVIAHAGKLRYVRRIALDMGKPAGDQTVGEWAVRLANELDQSIYGYLLRSSGREPERVLVVGKLMRADGLIEALGARVNRPVERARLAQIVDVANTEAAASGELLGEFPGCVGALIARHRRLRGERAAAPPLRQRVRRFGEINLRKKRIALVCANVVLFVELVALAYAVRVAQLATATRVIEDSRPYLQNLEKLENEVSVLEYESRRQRSMLDTLLPITEALPPAIKVESLKIDAKGKVTIAGRTKSVEEASQKAISAMRASRALANPQFLGATKGKDDFTFRITCDLRAGR